VESKLNCLSIFPLVDFDTAFIDATQTESYNVILESNKEQIEMDGEWAKLEFLLNHVSAFHSPVNPWIGISSFEESPSALNANNLRNRWKKYRNLHLNKLYVL